MEPTHQPGQVISPGSPAPAPTNPGAPEPTRPTEVETPPAPQPAPTPVAVPAPAVQTPPAPAPISPSMVPASTTADSVSWTAAEFVAHDKSFGWYALVVLGGLVAAGLDYLLTKDIFSTIIIVLAAIAFAVFAARKPRQQQFSLSRDGIHVGSRQYNYSSFKAFSISEESGSANLVFAPLQRFMPPLTVHLATDVEDDAVDFLSDMLPFEQRSGDAVDGLMKRLRF